MELVVLLSEDGAAIGTAPKAEVHTTDTALHLAFSCYLLNDRGEVLVTRRALENVASLVKDDGVLFVYLYGRRSAPLHKRAVLGFGITDDNIVLRD